MAQSAIWMRALAAALLACPTLLHAQANPRDWVRRERHVRAPLRHPAAARFPPAGRDKLDQFLEWLDQPPLQ